MTTKNSPLSALKFQADGMARMITAFERGESIDPKFASKLTEARTREVVKIGVVMDDKIIMLDLPWTMIKATGEVGLSEYILNLMRESRDTVQ